MQQLSENVLMIGPGDNIPVGTDAVKIYLSGTEDLNPGNPEKWQNKFATAVQLLSDRVSPNAINVFKRNWIIINPLSAPQMNPVNSLANPECVQKFNWRQDMMAACDCIFLNIMKKSQSPYPMYELGLLCQSGKVVCRCSEEYQNYAWVKLSCDRFGIPLLPNISNVKDVLWAFYSINPNLQTNSKLQLPS